MNLKINSFKVLGNLRGENWVSIYEGDSGLSSDPKGRLWVVVSSVIPESVTDRISFGREVLVDLHREYYNHNSNSNFYGLKNAVENIFSKYKDKFLNLEIGCASWDGNVLNSAVVGGAQAGIFRNHFLVKILVSSGSDVVCASGYPRDGDVFILGTKSFFECFSNQDFSLFSGKEEISEGSLSILREKAFSFDGRVAGSLICFSSDDFSFRENIELNNTKAQSPIINNFVKGNTISLIGKKISMFLSKQNRNSFHRKIYVRSTFQGLEDVKSRKKNLFFALFLILFIFSLSIIGSKIKNAREKRNFFQSELLNISSKIDEAKKIASLDPERSRKLFFEAKEKVSSLKSQNSGDQRLKKIDEDIKDSQETILKEYYQEQQLFLDLSLLSQGFSISEMKADANDILVLDQKGKRLVDISFESKKTQVIGGPDDFENYQDFGIYSGDFFVLTSKALFNAKDNKKELFRNDFGDDALVNFYAGNAYVLDKNPSRIYRLLPTKDGFSLPQIWTIENLGVDFSKAKDWFIDGMVWVLIDDNQIFRFSRGVPERFSLKGVYPSLDKIDSIYSNEELKFVYLLDSKNGRIVVVDKNGSYVCQYFADKLKESSFLVVSEKQKKAIFSSQNKLYSVDLKHL
jgi:hypothetical protein